MPLDDFFDPFGHLAGAAGKVVADAWTVAMLGLWNAGLWVLRLVFTIMDAFLTPDLSAAGPGAQLYRTTFWIAGALVVVMAMVQLGVAAVRRDGQSLARVGIGFAQFAIVWAAWITYLVAVVAACGGLTRALMQSLLRVNSWSAWRPWQEIEVQDLTDGTVATVLGLMGLLLWLAAIGHLLVMLTRAGALMVLAATTPVAAAGLLSDAGRAWFWKSLRWFHAAALSPVLMVLVLGVGVQMTTGVANGLADKTEAAIGTALPGVVLILIGCFAPLALFKLLAFVDPGTSSGAALRQGLATQGGLQGLLAGSGSGAGGSNAAASTDQLGRSQGESAGEDATSARFTQAEGGLLSKVGPIGAAAAQGLGLMQSVGAKGATVGADAANQMGVGHQSYQPDFSGTAGRRQDAVSGGGQNTSGNGNGTGSGDTSPGSAPCGDATPNTLLDPTGGGAGPGQATAGADAAAAVVPAPLTPGQASAGPGSGQPRGGGGAAGAGPKAGAGGGAAGAGGAEAAAAVPIVPV